MKTNKYLVTGYQLFAIECGIGTLIEEIFCQEEYAEKRLEYLRPNYPDLELTLLPILELNQTN